MGSTICGEPSDFEFLTETGPDGQTRVKLSQDLPVPFEKVVANEQLMIRLLTANGIKNIKNIVRGDAITGGQTGENAKCTINFTDDTPSKKILVKGCPGHYKHTIGQQIREAWYYDKIAPIMKEQGFKCPWTLLNVYDRKRARSLVFMELLDGCVEVALGGIEEWYDVENYVPKDAKPSGVKLDMQQCFDLIADQFAVEHLAFWNDKEFLKKAYPFLNSGSYYLQKEKADYDACLTDTNRVYWMTSTIMTSYQKMFPLGAKATAQTLKNSSWERYQEMIQSYKHSCFNHGDCHFKNMMFNTNDQKMYFIDFECIAFGHPATDLGYFMVQLSPSMRNKFFDGFLARYIGNLEASGKVAPGEFTVEGLKKDCIMFGNAKYAFLYTCFCFMPFPDPQIIKNFLQIYEDFLKQYPECFESTMPITFLTKGRPNVPEEPTF